MLISTHHVKDDQRHSRALVSRPSAERRSRTEREPRPSATTLAKRNMVVGCDPSRSPWVPALRSLTLAPAGTREDGRARCTGRPRRRTRHRSQQIKRCGPPFPDQLIDLDWRPALVSSGGVGYIAAHRPGLLALATTERWQSGRSRRTRNAEYGQPYRGFESLPLRQPYRPLTAFAT
jgi:hypothetical protein